MKYSLLKPSGIIGILTLIISSVLLFEIKYNVQNIRKDISKVESEIFKNKEDIHILKAELSYITKPEILAKLAKQHLNLISIDPQRVKSVKINEVHRFFNKGEKRK